MQTIEGTKLTWALSKVQEKKEQSLWRAVCEETGKTFVMASMAQLVSSIHGYEEYARDVVGLYLSMSKIQSKLGRVH